MIRARAAAVKSGRDAAAGSRYRPRRRAKNAWARQVVNGSQPHFSTRTRCACESPAASRCHPSPRPGHQQPSLGSLGNTHRSSRRASSSFASCRTTSNRPAADASARARASATSTGSTAPAAAMRGSRSNDGSPSGAVPFADDAESCTIVNDPSSALGFRFPGDAAGIAERPGNKPYW